MPFNIGIDNNTNIPWPSLCLHLDSAESFTELGCGTGWLCNRVKNKYANIAVTGIDISETAINESKLRSQKINWKIQDLTTYNEKVDVVASIGVLHHIPGYSIYDLMCKTINISNNYTFIGLYHTNSRHAMFDFFSKYSKEKQKKLFKKMTPHMKSKQRESWFRDQFDNPFEQSTTLDVYKQVAKDTNTKLVFTNISTDKTYDSTRESLESFEFKSGFIYGGFKK
tara:strand:- start:200 stop:874 length:675 start_codon:yes stop_codon:yes gene_type:complete